jgi:hypothetical protein
MIILRCLLMGFHSIRTGACFPSYDAIQKATGLCRQSVAAAIARLEAVGILKVTRRLQRYVNEIGVVMCAQASNLYAFAEPQARIDLGPTNLPLMTKRFPARVHVIGSNYIPIIKEKPLWMKKEGFQGVGAAIFGNGDRNWRERARAAISTPNK